MILVNVDRLSYTYNPNTPLQTEALDKVSFSVVEGEIIGVIGPSGSGKSCLLRCLSGVIEKQKDTVMWRPLRNAAPKVGLVIQEPEQQFFLDNLIDEVGFAISQLNLSREEQESRVRAALAAVGYDGDLNVSPFRLSGGQQRRVALASILVMEPDLLLLDEPTVGLDASGLAMLRCLSEAGRKNGQTLLMVSHDLDFLYQVVDRFLLLVQGRLEADFQKKDFYKYSRCLEDLGIGIPEVVSLEERGFPRAILEENQ